MISSKTRLVALREYVENLRTKAFWIGILALPLIYAVVIFLGRVFEEAKDVRTYTVIDNSGWLFEAVQERATERDLSRLLRDIPDQARDLQGRLTEVERDLAGDDLSDAERAEITAEKAEIEAEMQDLGDPLEEFWEGLPEDHIFRQLAAELGAEVGPDALRRLQAGQQDPEAFAAVLRYFRKISGDRQKMQELSGALAGLSIQDYRYKAYTQEQLGEDPEGFLREELNQGRLFAFFVIDDDPVALPPRGSGSGDDTDGAQEHKYISNNRTDRDLRNWFERHATEVVRDRRIEQYELSPEQQRAMTAGFDFDDRKVDATGQEQKATTEDTVGQYAPAAFVYLLWLSVFIVAQMLLTNTVEEKSNRIIEVLLSSVSPTQLMTGKILGIALTGLTMVGSWALFLYLGIQALPLFGIDVSGLGFLVAIGNPAYLAAFIGYFIAGYLFYAALLVAIGSVCNSLKEAQNLQTPVIMVLLVPLAAMVPIVNDPNGTVARVITYIPLYTPFAMMNRAGGPPPAWEYALTSVIIVISVWLAFRGAAKIFRIGVLMTGKPPKIGEILRWLREPVGDVVLREEELPEDEQPKAAG